MSSLPSLNNTMALSDIRQQLLAPSFPLEKMTELLDHDNHEMRQQFRQFNSFGGTVLKLGTERHHKTL